MKPLINITFIVVFAFIFGCKNSSTLVENSVIIQLESKAKIPDSLSVFISGDFEGWTGGKEEFKLKKEDSKHTILLQQKDSTIQFKFTLGSWKSVELDADRNELNNRSYSFSKPNDTLKLSVDNWTSFSSKKELVLPDNVQILSDSIYMPQLDRYRRVWVYTPPNYKTSTEGYPVVYMHDAQNLFMNETSFAGEWKIDEIMDALSRQSNLDLIIVGIDHGEDKRVTELSPFKFKYAENPEGEQYIDFIVNTLKPKIDSEFRTKSDKENTAIFGSSLGGLISHYGGFKRNDVFGKIGIFSPAYWSSKKAYTYHKAQDTKIYMLVGTQESDNMLTDARSMKDMLLQNGFDDSSFLYKEVKGGKHTEAFWSANFPEAISWLFNKPIPKQHPLIKELKPTPLQNIDLASGQLQRIENFPSQYIKTRPVDIWLPNNYNKSKTYSVLYMHDGQMLFDAKTTWNKQEWKVDEWASQLIKEGKTRDFIVVGIHNIPNIRWQDLFPQKAIEFVSEEDKSKLKSIAGESDFQLNGDNYLRFLVKELKPYIDNNFRTKPDKANTFVMGSSMGGLMSMYAISEYPNVFAAASCLSTHWVGAQVMEDNPLPEAIFTYMEQNLPKAGSHKLYFDYGNKTLDEHYPQYAPRVDEILKQKGYTTSDSRNLFFEGTEHSENSWNKRLNIPLEFMLAKNFDGE